MNCDLFYFLTTSYWQKEAFDGKNQQEEQLNDFLSVAIVIKGNFFCPGNARELELRRVL